MDRRAVWAIVLMMAIALAPALLLKQGRRAGGQVGGESTAAAPAQPSPAPAPPPARPPAPPPASDTAGAAPEDTVLVTSPLYTYGVSTRGARLVLASPVRYPSMAVASRGRPAQLIRRGSGLLGMTLVRGGDTLRLADWTFEPSARKLEVTAPASVRFGAARADVSVELSYAFRPDDYRIGISGRVTGVG